MSLARDTAVIFRGKDGLFYFRVRAANSEIVWSSEGYEHKRDALALLASRMPHVPIVDETLEQGGD